MIFCGCVICNVLNILIQLCPSFSLQWFCESAALDTEDSLEKQKVYKFRGDLAVRQGNYQVINSV